MTKKKDYKLIAEGIQLHRKSYGNATDTIVREVIYYLGQVLQMDNDNFNYDKFYQACMCCNGKHKDCDANNTL